MCHAVCVRQMATWKLTNHTIRRRWKMKKIFVSVCICSSRTKKKMEGAKKQTDIGAQTGDLTRADSLPRHKTADDNVICLAAHFFFFFYVRVSIYICVSDSHWRVVTRLRLKSRQTCCIGETAAPGITWIQVRCMTGVLTVDFRAYISCKYSPTQDQSHIHRPNNTIVMHTIHPQVVAFATTIRTKWKDFQFQ